MIYNLIENGTTTEYSNKYFRQMLLDRNESIAHTSYVGGDRFYSKSMMTIPTYSYNVLFTAVAYKINKYNMKLIRSLSQLNKLHFKTILHLIFTGHMTDSELEQYINNTGISARRNYLISLLTDDSDKMNLFNGFRRAITSYPILKYDTKSLGKVSDISKIKYNSTTSPDESTGILHDCVLDDLQVEHWRDVVTEETVKEDISLTTGLLIAGSFLVSPTIGLAALGTNLAKSAPKTVTTVTKEKYYVPDERELILDKNKLLFSYVQKCLLPEAQRRFDTNTPYNVLSMNNRRDLITDWFLEAVTEANNNDSSDDNLESETYNTLYSSTQTTNNYLNRGITYNKMMMAMATHGSRIHDINDMYDISNKRTTVESQMVRDNPNSDINKYLNKFGLSIDNMSMVENVHNDTTETKIARISKLFGSILEQMKESMEKLIESQEIDDEVMDDILSVYDTGNMMELNNSDIDIKSILSNNKQAIHKTPTYVNGVAQSSTITETNPIFINKLKQSSIEDRLKLLIMIGAYGKSQGNTYDHDKLMNRVTIIEDNNYDYFHINEYNELVEGGVLGILGKNYTQPNSLYLDDIIDVLNGIKVYDRNSHSYTTNPIVVNGNVVTIDNVEYKRNEYNYIVDNDNNPITNSNLFKCIDSNGYIRLLLPHEYIQYNINNYGNGINYTITIPDEYLYTLEDYNPNTINSIDSNNNTNTMDNNGNNNTINSTIHNNTVTINNNNNTIDSNNNTNSNNTITINNNTIHNNSIDSIVSINSNNNTNTITIDNNSSNMDNNSMDNNSNSNSIDSNNNTNTMDNNGNNNTINSTIHNNTVTINNNNNTIDNNSNSNGIDNINNNTITINNNTIDNNSNSIDSNSIVSNSGNSGENGGSDGVSSSGNGIDSGVSGIDSGVSGIDSGVSGSGNGMVGDGLIGLKRRFENYFSNGFSYPEVTFTDIINTINTTISTELPLSKLFTNESIYNTITSNDLSLYNQLTNTNYHFSRVIYLHPVSYSGSSRTINTNVTITLESLKYNSDGGEIDIKDWCNIITKYIDWNDCDLGVDEYKQCRYIVVGDGGVELSAIGSSVNVSLDRLFGLFGDRGVTFDFNIIDYSTGRYTILFEIIEALDDIVGSLGGLDLGTSIDLLYTCYLFGRWLCFVFDESLEFTDMSKALSISLDDGGVFGCHRFIQLIRGSFEGFMDFYSGLTNVGELVDCGDAISTGLVGSLVDLAI